jgi:hypothetical protein
VSSSAHAKHNYDDPSAPPRICLNCRAALRGPYCAQCGQHDVDYHRSFHHLTHDLLENLFHFEGKFFTSVAWLLAKPGKLTADFNAGQRQSQLNPLRFYIFVTVLFFLGVHLLNHGHIFPFDRKKADTLSRDFQQKVARTTAAAEGLTPEQGERVGALIEKAVDASSGRMDQKTIEDVIAQVRQESAAAAKSDSVITEAADSAAKKAGIKARKIHQQQDGFDFERALKKKFDDGELTLSKMADEIERRVPTLLFIA